jgi:hypothetical protein
MRALLDEQRTTQARQQAQLRALERSGGELEAFLDAGAALLVGPDLRVRRCTPGAAALYQLLPDDLGRSLQAGQARLALLLDLLPGACVLGSLLADPRGGPGDARLAAANLAFARMFPEVTAPLEGLAFLEALPALAPLWPKVAAWARDWPDANLPRTPLRLEGAGFRVDVQPLAGSEVIFIIQGTPDAGAGRV